MDGGFGKVLLRGDTDFALTKNFDRWTDEDKWFVFGIDANPSFVARVEQVEEGAWNLLIRRDKGRTRETQRARPENVKERVVVKREYENKRHEKERGQNRRHSLMAPTDETDFEPALNCDE